MKKKTPRHTRTLHTNTANESGWLNAPPSQRFLPTIIIVLAGLATASFMVLEKGAAGEFGFPSDTGWHDLAAARTIAVSPTQTPLPGSESPGFLPVLAAAHVLSRGDHSQIILLAKLLSLFALSITIWNTLRLLRSSGLTSGIAEFALGIMLPLSAPLVWTGVSGMGIVWAIALVTVGLADLRTGHDTRGTCWLSAAVWFSPAALTCLPLIFVERKPGTVIRGTITAAFITAYGVWNLFVTGGTSVLPTGMLSAPGFSQWLAWLRNGFQLAGVSFSGGLHPPLLGVLAIYGAWKTGRENRTLWLGFTLPVIGAGLFLHEPAQHEWSLFIALPALLVCAAIGFHYLLTAFNARFGFAKGAVIAAIGLYALWAAPQLWARGSSYALQVENTVFVKKTAEQWMAGTNPAQPVATTAPGVLTYFLTNPVIDLNEGSRFGTDPVSIGLRIGETRPHWVLLNLGAGRPYILTEHYRKVNQTSFRINAGVYPPGPLELYERMYTEQVAELPRPVSGLSIAQHQP